MSRYREVVPAALDGERLDRLVALVTGCSRSRAAALVDEGRVLVDTEPVTERSWRVAEGDEIEVDWSGPEPSADLEPDARVPVPVVFADDDVVVVDKPPGLVVHPGAGHRNQTLVNGLVARFPEIAAVGDDRQRPGIVHRLDKDTSGLMVVARSPLAFTSLVDQMSRRTVDRRYQALVWGHPDTRVGLIDGGIGRSRRARTKMAVSASGRPAQTRYEVVSTWRDPVAVALVHCALLTGRTHQIRVHLSSIGHPVVGDPTYGGDRSSLEVPRVFLHAGELAFDHPVTGQRRTFTAPLPADLAEVLGRLR